MTWAFGGVGTVCFVGLLAFETLTDQDEFRALDFLGDAFTLLLTIGAAIAFALFLSRIRLQQEEQRALLRDLEVAREEGRAWRTKSEAHLTRLRSEIDLQLEQWGMSAAERDVGLLILKGLSHKEIAVLRKTSDATVRQQAQAIYRKSSLPGKTAFCAYFLEDLFATGEAQGTAADGGNQGPLEPEARSASSARR